MIPLTPEEQRRAERLYREAMRPPWGAIGQMAGGWLGTLLLILLILAAVL